MRSISYILLLSLLSIVACHKYNVNGDDLGGQNYIRGRVFLADTLNYDLSFSLAVTNYLPNAAVRVAYADSTNYIYSATADGNGYFTFANLQNTAYQVEADTLADTIYFHGATPVTLKQNSPDTIALVLYPSQTMQNGVLYIIKDSLSKGFLAGATVSLYNSPTMFQYAQLDSTVTPNYSCTSNGAGRAWHLKIAPGFYNVLLKYAIGAKTITATDTITVGPTGITEHIIPL